MRTCVLMLRAMDTGKYSHAEKAQIHANFELWICVGILHHPFVAGLFCHLILVSGMCC